MLGRAVPYLAIIFVSMVVAYFAQQAFGDNIALNYTELIVGLGALAWLSARRRRR
jgi:hypothetical protein